MTEKYDVKKLLITRKYKPWSETQALLRSCVTKAYKVFGKENLN